MSKYLPAFHTDQGMAHPPSSYRPPAAVAGVAGRGWYGNKAPRQEWAGRGGLPSTFLQEWPWQNEILFVNDRYVRK